MRRPALALAAAFVLGSLLAFAVVGLLADAPPRSAAGAQESIAPAALTPAPGGPLVLANSTFTLGIGSAQRDLVVPANVSVLRIQVTLLQGAGAGLRVDGPGGCMHDFGDVTAQGQTLAFDCAPAPHGAGSIALSEQAGQLAVRLDVLGLAGR